MDKITEIIKNTSEENQEKVDWTKAWSTKYPVLKTYQAQVDIAKYAKEQNLSLTTFNFARKYSLVYYGEIPVTFKPEQPLELLNENLDDEKNMVVVKNRDMQYFDNRYFDVIFKGRKFSLLEEKGVVNVSNNK